MKIFCTATAAISAAFLFLQSAGAMEFDFLQADPRFNGGEFALSDPTHPTFWFYNQYQPIHAAMQAAGINVVAVGQISMPALVADSDCLYMPIPSNPTASTYPLSDSEINVLQQYTANSQYTGGRSIIFNLTGASAAMTNDLLGRLGLSGHMAAGTITGQTSYPIPGSPVISGPFGTAQSFTMNDVGYFDSLGSMRSLVNVDGHSVLPYVEKGDLSSSSGAYFFILDDKLLPDWTSQDPNYQMLFENMTEYAMADQFKHYTVPATTVVAPVITLGPPPLRPAVLVPEPASLGMLGVGVLALLARRRVK